MSASALTDLPSGYSTRPAQLSDHLLLFDLVNAYSLRLNGRIDLDDPEIIRLDWQNEGFDPGRDVRLVIAPDGTAVGLVEAWLISSPPVHPWIWVCVHPDHMGKGLWEYLLAWGQARALAALDLVPPGLRIAPRTGVEHHHAAACALIQAQGWTYVRSFYRMETELGTAGALPSLPAGITIRPYDPASETEAVYQVFVDSFRDHYGFVEQPFERGFREFQHNLINVPGFDPACWFVAVDGGEIAGICLCRPSDHADPDCGWVNELGVRRPWRKRGLGTALLLQAFDTFRALGRKRAALGVDANSLTGALRIYERAGMHIARQYDHFEKEMRAGRELATQALAEQGDSR